MFTGSDDAPRVPSNDALPEGVPRLRVALVETAALPGVTLNAIAERFGWSAASVHREITAGLRQMHEQLRRTGAPSDATPPE